MSSPAIAPVRACSQQQSVPPVALGFYHQGDAVKKVIRAVRGWTLLGVSCLAIAFPLVFFLVIEPVNWVIEQATPATLPAQWQQLRRQWEYGHVVNFVLTLTSFAALLVSVLVETPAHRMGDRQ